MGLSDPSGCKSIYLSISCRNHAMSAAVPNGIFYAFVSLAREKLLGSLEARQVLPLPWHKCWILLATELNTRWAHIWHHRLRHHELHQQWPQCHVGLSNNPHASSHASFTCRGHAMRILAGIWLYIIDGFLVASKQSAQASMRSVPYCALQSPVVEGAGSVGPRPAGNPVACNNSSGTDG